MRVGLLVVDPARNEDPDHRLAQRVLEATPDHISIVDRDYVYRYVNRAYEQAHARSAEQMVGMSVRALLGDEIFTTVVEPMLVRALGGEEIAYEAWFDFVETGRRYMQVRYLPMRRADGTVDSVMVLAHDTTGRRVAEDALRESEERYRNYITRAPHGVFVTDETGRYLEVNPTAVRMTGYSEEELLRMSIKDMVPEERLQETLEYFGVLLATGSLQQRFQLKRKGAEPFWVNLGAARVGNNRIIGLCEDVSAEVEMEERLGQSQKMEAVGLLAGGVAHDFNNLLTAILGNASMVLLRPLDANSREQLEEIVAVAKRAATLTRQLLTFSRREPRSAGTVSPDDVVSSLGQMLARLIGEHIRMENSLDARGAHVAIDRGGLEQILVNLVVNARDAMPEGGRLRVSTRPLHLDDTGAASRRVAPGDYVELEVADEGQGMDAATRGRVFEPFFTTKPPGAGSGLGLSTVYGLVQATQGDVDIDRERGAGTRVSVLLPTAQPGEEKPDEEVETVERGGGVVLLVEDESLLRRIVERILRHAGYTVLAAENAETALELFRRDPRRVDLLLTDVVMPGMSGPQLVQECKTVRSDLPVLFMSGYPDRVSSGPSGRLPASPLLDKPFSPEGLTTAVARVLRAR